MLTRMALYPLVDGVWYLGWETWRSRRMSPEKRYQTRCYWTRERPPDSYCKRNRYLSNNRDSNSWKHTTWSSTRHLDHARLEELQTRPNQMMLTSYVDPWMECRLTFHDLPWNACSKSYVGQIKIAIPIIPQQSWLIRNKGALTFAHYSNDLINRFSHICV